jgi:hypothetical protein
MLDASLDWNGVRVTLQDLTPTLDARFTSTLQVLRADGDWSTLYVTHWEGVMADFIHTYMSEVVSAWLYGAPEEVVRAHKSVHRQALAHKRAHEFL